MTRSLVTILALGLIAGCGSQQPSEFDRLCRELSVRPQAAQALREFQANRGGNSEARFELLRAFCMRRQLAAPRDQHPDLADPILDTSSVAVLLGPPDEKTDDGAWLYFFNPNRDWHLELSFRDGQLFHTSFRQLISPEEMATNNTSEHIP